VLLCARGVARCKEISLARISPGSGDRVQAIQNSTKSPIAFTTESPRFFFVCILSIAQL